MRVVDFKILMRNGQQTIKLFSEAGTPYKGIMGLFKDAPPYKDCKELQKRSRVKKTAID